MNNAQKLLERVNFPLLRTQRETLLDLAANDYLDARYRDMADGLTNLLDGLVDAMIEDGVPGAEKALLTEED